MLQFKMSQKVMASSLMANSFVMDSDSDADFDDIDSSRLRLTDSMGPQLANEVFGTSTPKNGNFRADVVGAFINVSDDRDLSGSDQDLEPHLGKPRRRPESVGLDFDKTPTNDSSNNHLFAIIADFATECSGDVNGRRSSAEGNEGQLLSTSTRNGCDIVDDASACAQDEPNAQS